MTLDIEQERPAFEAAYRAKWPTICAVNHRKFELDEDNEYIDYTVQVALEMWLAAKRASMGSADPVKPFAYITPAFLDAFVDQKIAALSTRIHKKPSINNDLALYTVLPSTDAKDTERLNFITGASAWFCQYMKNGAKPARYRMIDDGEPWGKWHSTPRKAIDAAIAAKELK